MLFRGARPDDGAGERRMRIGRKIMLGVAVVALLLTTAERRGPARGPGVAYARTRRRLGGARLQAEVLQHSNSVLNYHGGQYTQTKHHDLLVTPGSAWQSGYMNAVNGFFANVTAKLSGTGDNPYSTLLQYYDTAGHIGYRSTLAGGCVNHGGAADGCPAYNGYASVADARRCTRSRTS